MQDADIVIKPRDVMPAGARLFRPRSTSMQAVFRRRDGLAVRAREWICAGRV